MKRNAIAGLERAAAPRSRGASASPLGPAPPRCLRIAMIGTRGVPARYGGFETAVEEIGRRLAVRGHAVTVFCRGGESQASSYDGMRLVHIPVLRLKIGETLSRTALSVAHSAARHADVAIVFNVANAPLLPVLRAARVPVALNVDGLEWQRAKWSGAGRRYYRACEKAAVRLASELIADAPGIQAYYLATHGATSRMIPYGANVVTEPALGRLEEVGLRPCEYHLVVARLEPENNVHVILEGYRRSRCVLPLVIVGAAPYAKAYVRTLSATASADSRVRMLGAIWDQELLDALYAGASTYVHGHSVGGTNPGLLRAMGAGARVLAYDVCFNRDVVENTGSFWITAEDLALTLAAAEDDRPALGTKNSAAIARVAERYSWDTVSDAYEQMCLEVSGRDAGRAADATARS